MAEMKRQAIQLEARSALQVGDRAAISQYHESLDYIPGNRLRAAVARAILTDCPYFDPAAAAPDRRYWVEYQGAEGCTTCTWQQWCEHFAAIRFGQATPKGAMPKGAMPLPLTAMRCKEHGAAHELVDTLLYRLVRQQRLREPYNQAVPLKWPQCPVCQGRLEGHAGWYDMTTKKTLPRPNRLLLTRVQIDRHRGAAADQQLYTIAPLAEGAVFCGELIAPAAPAALQELHVGARISSGMGRCGISCSDLPLLDEALAGRLLAFQKGLQEARTAAGLAHTSDIYMALTLLSPAVLGPLPAESPAAADNQAARHALAQALGVEQRLAGWELAHLFTGYQVRGGWRLQDGEWAAPQHYLNAGSVLVWRRPALALDEALPPLRHIQDAGIGLRTEDGFGQVQVCCAYHIDKAVKQSDGN